MSNFERENRYIVIKRSDLKKVPVAYRSHLVDPMLSLLSHLPHRECLVIESDWPEYEPVWQMIERRTTGAEPVPPAGGDVEVLAFPEFRDLEAHPVADIEYQRDVGYNQALADARPIVTRLQVEVERLKDRLADANAIANLAATNLEEFKEDHRSELTKARETLREIVCACGDEKSHGYISMLAEDALSNQSAPADKECSHRFMSLADDPRQCADCDAIETLVERSASIAVVELPKEIDTMAGPVFYAEEVRTAIRAAGVWVKP